MQALSPSRPTYRRDRPSHGLQANRKAPTTRHAPRTRRRRARRVLRAGFIVMLEVSIVLLLLMAVRATPVPPAEAAVLGAQAVADDPATYRSRSLEVQGVVGERPARIRREDRGAFFLEGAEGGRVLVVPSKAIRLTAFRNGTTVLVRGTVVVPPRSGRVARQVTSRTAIAARGGAGALIKATKIELAR